MKSGNFKYSGLARSRKSGIKLKTNMKNLYKLTVVALLLLNLVGVGWLLATRPSHAECRGIVDSALKERETAILAKYSPILNKMEGGFGFPKSSPRNVEELLISFGKIVFKPVPKIERSGDE